MQKRYVVRLTDSVRDELRGVVTKLKGTGQKVRRAQILLKADANGPNWTDSRIISTVLVPNENGRDDPSAVGRTGF